MKFQALYRKYRPNNFKEVAGQSIAVTILNNAIKNNKIGHAYLFYGPRGTGKTSLAKVLARAVNCKTENDDFPCGKCLHCFESFQKNCIDILEIDAASNNGVDEIRELKSKVNILPSLLNYKVYIIDEVHMLSIGAFNALLKTLEEPPEHVIFILATTELNKVPSTILSRCQVLEFSRISNDDMKNKIKEICNLENIEIDNEAILEIVQASDGGMRDALVLLDKLITYTETQISSEDVRKVCQKTSTQTIIEIVDSLISNEKKKLITSIQEVYNQNYDLVYLLEDIIENLNEQLLLEFNTNNCSLIQKLCKLADEMRKSSINKKTYLTVGLLKILSERSENIEQIISREIILENNLEKNSPKLNKNEEKETNRVEETLNQSNFKEIRINNTFCKAHKKYLNELKQKWKLLSENVFDKKVGAQACILLDSIPVVANDKYVILITEYSSLAEKINNIHHEIEKVILDITSLCYNIVAISKDEWDIEKKNYMKNLRENYQYLEKNDLYISDPNKDIDKNYNKRITKSKIEEKVMDLFDSDLIEIK